MHLKVRQPDWSYLMMFIPFMTSVPGYKLTACCYELESTTTGLVVSNEVHTLITSVPGYKLTALQLWTCKYDNQLWSLRMKFIPSTISIPGYIFTPSQLWTWQYDNQLWSYRMMFIPFTISIPGYIFTASQLWTWNYDNQIDRIVWCSFPSKLVYLVTNV